MLRASSRLAVVILCIFIFTPLFAIDPERDFSGKWTLDARGSNTRNLPMKPDAAFTVAQQDVALRCSAVNAGATAQWTYLLDGTETRSRQGEDSWSTVAKWEGTALLVNTQVSGGHEYTVMDRWQLSRDRSTLIISRQVVSRNGTIEGELLYTRQPATETDPTTPTAEPPAQVQQAPVQQSATAQAETGGAIPPDPSVQPAQMQRRPDAPPPADFTIPAGTHIALTLRNQLDTKRTHTGDHVYLDVSVPVFANGRQVIPKGSYVNGIVTESKPATGMKGKGQLFIHFESLILPNGVQRDFHSRVGSADSGKGTVNSEGGVTGTRDSSGDVRDVAIGAGTGATIGVMSGHGLGGAGIGAVAGGAAGEAIARLSHKADVVLPRGTMIEMILDRDLVYTKEELGRY
ncbi:MAG TPA: hypothetical protein VML19_25095 [Verrucomicrobiae bacterium]|nr:hypothetical protein [Verrucomicrobiae bacterium]